MAIPKYFEFFPPIMELLSDGITHTSKEIRDYCAKKFELSEEDLQEKVPSGHGSLLNNRVGWAKTYLVKAGLISLPARACCQVTDAGRIAIKNGTEKITLKFLKQYDSFQDFFCKKAEESSDESAIELPEESIANSEQNPQEQMEYSMRQINEALADDLMLEILKMSPYDFEKLVVQLLKNMGYGEPIATKKSGDEGIDGLVKADKFGFDTIYVQAKQWKPDSTVSRPEIQKFLGALAGQGASKGLFITTAKYSSEAILFAQRHLQQKIILVDGEMLTRLMIEYNLGVSVETTYEVKRIDYDFFHEEI